MAKKKDERFLKVHEEGNGFGWMRTVWVDKQTGVNYLFVNSGKPVVTPVPNTYTDD